MTSKIRVLTEDTINKIAAGEVIENPASVVKELVENSIDAGSDDITVEIKGGGRQLIRVTDNGSGMQADDAVLCLERHATSKIRDVEDIHSILTMGFRGEAIPSIASISKFSLLTCPEGKKEGTLVVVDGGKLLECTPAPRSQGTTIEVKSLFFNVPVRKQFQKSPTHDIQEILKMLSSIALGHPHIKFHLISNGETLLQVNARKEGTFLEKLGDRIKVVLGPDFYEATYPLEGFSGDYCLEGYIGVPTFTRQNRTGQSLFINQRAISSLLVSYAVRDGYGTTLPTNRFPVYVLHLSMPGTLVDVNVHPQKREVRLRQEQQLKEMIVKSVEQALQKGAPSTFSVQPSIAFGFNSVAAPAFEKKETMFFQERIKYEPFEEIKPLAVREEPQLFKPQDYKKTPLIIGTIKGYILLNGLDHPTLSKEGLCLIDQKAAHARIIFEKLNVEQKSQLQLQTLLIPYSWEAQALEAALLRERLQLLNESGIKIHESGPNRFMVDALPEVFGNTDVRALVTDIVHGLSHYEEDKKVEKEMTKQIALAASRAAISLTKRLSIDEAQRLTNQLLHCQMPLQCPLGKPTLLHLSQEELLKLFKNGDK
jgi:DNA mismatch repair protein MutL